MTNEYSNIEIRTFAQTVLKVLCIVFMVFFLISSVFFYIKELNIRQNSDAIALANKLYVANKELVFNILTPSIYADFEDTNAKQNRLNEIAKEFKAKLSDIHIIKSAQIDTFEQQRLKLNANMLTYTGLVAKAGSEYDAFNILYLGTGAAETRQNVLGYVFANELDTNSLNEYVNYLSKAKATLKVRTMTIENERNELVLNLNKSKPLSPSELAKQKFLAGTGSLSKEKIAALDDELARIDKLERFFEKASSLLRTTKELDEYKIAIAKSGLESSTQKLGDFLAARNEVLKSEQLRIQVASGILFLLGAICALMNFYYGMCLARVLNVFYKAFMNSPIQQSLIKSLPNNTHSSELTNNAFRFGSSSLKNQSSDLRVKEANNFYSQLRKILAVDDDTRGFEIGTLVYESHNKLSPYDEDAQANRKDSRFYSVFRKQIGDDYELISKVDVSKKIWQIKDYKDRIDTLRRKLERDDLTDLLSLQALQDKEINNPKGSMNKIFLYLHIDHFNDVRLNYSTVVIDEIIKAFASSLKNALDTDDNHNNLENTAIYHLQMDEFAIVYNSLAAAQEAAEKITAHFSSERKLASGRNKFNLKFSKNERLSDLELNIGISSERDITRKRNNSDESINRLAQAIIASYESSRIKVPYVIYEEGRLGVEIQYAKQQQVTLQIRQALLNDNIFVVAQGVHDSMSKEAAYYELLVRMRDENGAVVPPGLFLDIARRVGLYKDIQWVVISKAFALLEKYPGAKFSINMANSDIMSPETRRYFLRKLSTSKFAHNLCVEILESEGIEQYDEVVDFLSEIKKHGAKVAIDDFGSGYSNYYRLLKVQFDYLKVDGSIIASLPHDNNAKVVLKTIVDFAHEQGYEVVAEFVSSPEILQIIRDFGIEKSQGYELSKPESPENIFIS